MHFLEQKGELNEAFFNKPIYPVIPSNIYKKDKSDEINGIDLEKRVVLNFVALIINGIVKK